MFVLIPYFDFVVVVLQVGAIGIGTQVTPFAYNSIAEKTIMPFIAVGKKDGVADLPSRLAAGANGGCPVHFGTHFEDCMLAQGKGAPDDAAIHDLRIFPYVYRTAIGIDDTGIHP